MNPLRVRRLNGGLSITDLAKAAGVNADTISAIEKGAMPQARTLVKLAEALGCTAADLDPLLAQQAAAAVADAEPEAA